MSPWVPTRRQQLSLGAASALQGCASIPDIDRYLAATDDPLQRHYTTQRAVSEGSLVSAIRPVC